MSSVVKKGHTGETGSPTGSVPIVLRCETGSDVGAKITSKV